MSYSILRKAISEVIPEGLNVDANQFKTLLMKYTVPLGVPLTIRFGGPSGTKIWEFKRAYDKVRTGVITYPFPPQTGTEGKEKDDNFSTGVAWSVQASRTMMWKLDIGAVYANVIFLVDLYAYSGAHTYWFKTSTDGSNYTDVYTASISAGQHHYLKLQLSNVRYIVLDAQYSTSGYLYMHEAFAYVAPPEKETTVGTGVTEHVNAVYGEAIDIHILSSGAVCYWGYLKDDFKITLIEGTIS